MGKKVLAGFLVFVLLGVLGYHRFGSDGLTTRQVVDVGVDQARKIRKLNPEEEGLLRVQLAIADYQARFQNPPASLSDLIPDYFDQIPTDPTSRRPYEYSRDKNRYELRVQRAEGESGSESGKQVGSTDGKAPTDGLEGQVDSDKKLTDKEIEVALLAEENFIYDPTGKRDPYRPFELNRTFDPNDKRTPLERYDLGQLRVTATLVGQAGEPTAFVEDEAGKGYPVRVGTKMGTNGGEVVSIHADGIKVVERFTEAFTGKQSENIQDMKIQREVEAAKKKNRAKKKKKP